MAIIGLMVGTLSFFLDPPLYVQLATGCVTSHISLLGAQWSGVSTRFDCLCEDDEIRAKNG